MMEPWVCHVILAVEITLYFEIRLWMHYKKLKKEAEKLDQHYVRQTFAIMDDLPQMTMDLILKKLNITNEKSDRSDRSDKSDKRGKAGE